jgi:hypothetical protein
MTGFTHSQSTQFGTATFWQITDIHIVINGITPNMTITMSGYASQADAYAGVYQPLGVIQLPVGPVAIAAFFATAQSNFTAFITNVWPDAVFVP